MTPAPATEPKPLEQERVDAERPEDAVEMQRPRLPCKSPMPSMLERDEHEASGHAVYRTWCEHCVAAKGQGNPHIADGEVCEVPEIGFDYAYMASGDSKCMPMICGRDRKLAHHAATFVPMKGRDPYALSYLVGWIRGLGYKRLVCRSDNERALLALLETLSSSLPEVEFVPKSSPEGDHAANGLAEVGVREIKGQVRTLRSQLEANLGARLEDTDPVLAWLPRHAANCMNRYRLGSDGRTAEQRPYGAKVETTRCYLLCKGIFLSNSTQWRCETRCGNANERRHFRRTSRTHRHPHLTNTHWSSTWSGSPSVTRRPKMGFGVCQVMQRPTVGGKAWTPRRPRACF